jgi:hypothetical protein
MQQNTARGGTSRTKPVVNKISLAYEFPRVPFEMGVSHIHSPEHISETHKLGAPFFKLMQVLPPKLSESKASITYFCSTLLVKNMYVRMYTNRPDQSNLLFFNSQGKALYQVCLTVTPSSCFSSHKLTIDIALFTGWLPKYFIASVMPLFLFINGLEDRLAFGHSHRGQESNSNLSEYRRIITSKLDSQMPVMDFRSEV